MYYVNVQAGESFSPKSQSPFDTAEADVEVFQVDSGSGDWEAVFS